jgi:hypothetical protein
MNCNDNELHMCLYLAIALGCAVRRVGDKFVVSHPHFGYVLIINALQNRMPPSLSKWLDKLIDRFI